MLTTRRITPFFDWLTVRILDTLLPERVHCNNSRVVKKPVSRFRSKKPKRRGTGQRVEAPKFHITNQTFELNLTVLIYTQIGGQSFTPEYHFVLTS